MMRINEDFCNKIFLGLFIAIWEIIKSATVRYACTYPLCPTRAGDRLARFQETKLRRTLDQDRRHILRSQILLALPSSSIKEGKEEEKEKKEGSR